jgi:hypothetical protein
MFCCKSAASRREKGKKKGLVDVGVGHSGTPRRQKKVVALVTTAAAADTATNLGEDVASVG